MAIGFCWLPNKYGPNLNLTILGSPRLVGWDICGVRLDQDMFGLRLRVGYLGTDQTRGSELSGLSVA